MNEHSSPLLLVFSLFVQIYRFCAPARSENRSKCYYADCFLLLWSPKVRGWMLVLHCFWWFWIQYPCLQKLQNTY